MLSQLSLQKFGAVSKDALEISNAFFDLGVEHNVFLSSKNIYLKNKLKNKKSFFIDTFDSSLISFFYYTFFSFRFPYFIKQLKKNNTDKIFITHFHLWAVFLVSFKKIFRFEIVYGVHENPFTNKEKSSFFVKKLEQFIFLKADRIVFYSNFLKDQMFDLVDDRQYGVLPLGRYESEKLSLKKETTSGLKLLFFGRIEKYKGLDLLVNSFDEIKKRGCGVSLTIAGRGQIDSGTMMKIKNNGIRLINRWLSDLELEDIILEHDLIILPYREASQSGVVSMSFGLNKPVITSNVGGIGEQVKDGINGLVFELNNQEDLVNKILLVYNNRKLVNELTEGIKKVCDNQLNWTKNLKKISTLFF